VETAEPALTLESTLCSFSDARGRREPRVRAGVAISAHAVEVLGARLAVLAASFVPFVAYATRALGPCRDGLAIRRSRSRARPTPRRRSAQACHPYKGAITAASVLPAAVSSLAHA
jgi:hypothetical protein